MSTRMQKFLNGQDPFNSHREYEKLEFDTIECPFEVVEGIDICFKCKSQKIIKLEVQTRSADEAMSIFLVCVQCKNRWSRNN